MENVRIDESWKRELACQFAEPYFKELTNFVRREYQNETVYPAPKYVFRAFDLCPFDEVKVVILGQDPYHDYGQANGLCFAVENNQSSLPPSLQNIFKEIESDLGQPLVHHNGDLSRWAVQGVLLLNATLTVKAHIAGSHQGHGWERFTDAVVATLSEKRKRLVFMLWGNHAKTKGVHIDHSKHFILEAAHPSPFSANNGFFGCKHFSKTNAYFVENGETPIDWL